MDGAFYYSLRRCRDHSCKIRREQQRGSQHQLEIDQRVVAVNYSSHLTVVALRIKRTSTGWTIESVKPQRVSRPLSGVEFCFLKEPSADALSLKVRTHSHAHQVKRLGNCGEIGSIDGPWFFRLQDKCAYNLNIVTCYQDARESRAAQITQNS